MTNSESPNVVSESIESDVWVTDEKSYIVPLEITILLSIFYGIIALLAVVANSLVLWIISSVKSMHSVTNCFLANLAIADIIIGVFAIPFQASLLQRWNLPYFMCSLCPFFQTISVNLSIFTLTAIAVDRHKAIVYPMAKRLSNFQCKVILFSIWVSSIAFSVPMAFAYSIAHLEDSINGETKPVCGSHFVNRIFFRNYTFTLVGLQYFVPLIAISVAYTKIGLKLWREKTPGNAQEARDAHIMMNKKKVTKMMLMVVCLFALFWAPLQTYWVIAEIYPFINKYKYINYFHICAHWLAMSNSAVNPFIYAIYNENFKKEFKSKLSFSSCRDTSASQENTERIQRSFWASIRTAMVNKESSSNRNESKDSTHVSRAGFIQETQI